MSPKHKELWRKCQLLLTVAIGVMPAAMMLCAALTPEMLGYAWLFPLTFTVLAFPAMGIPGKLRLLYGIAAWVAMMTPCVRWLQGMVRIVALVCAGGYGLILVLCLPIAGWSSEEELHPFVIGVLMAAHLIGQFVYYIDTSSFVSYLKPISGWVMVLFFAYVLLAMLSMNRRSLTSIGEQRQGVTKGMRRKHVLMTVGLFGVAMLFTLIPSVFGVISSVAGWISDAMDALRELFHRDYLPDETIVYETMPYAPTEPYVDRTPEWLNILIYYFYVAVGVPVLIFLLYKALQRYAHYLHSALKGLGRFLSSTTEDYEEEITDIRDEVQPERLERRRRKRGPGPEPKLSSPVDYVRYHYRRMRLKHKEWKDGSTARENLPESLAGVYERARYSDHPVTEEEAAWFKSETKKM